MNSYCALLMHEKAKMYLVAKVNVKLNALNLPM